MYKRQIQDSHRNIVVLFSTERSTPLANVYHRSVILELLSAWHRCSIRRETKLKIYHSLIRPIVAYGSEVWTMTVVDEKSLRIFERNILRKIYGPVREGENWRIRSNAELQHLIHERDLVKFIKSQRIRWLGHVESCLLYTSRCV